MNDMIRISATEFGKEVGRYQDVALTQPVFVTRNGRDRTVMISAEEYQRLSGATGRSSTPQTCRRTSLRLSKIQKWTRATTTSTPYWMTPNNEVGCRFLSPPPKGTPATEDLVIE